MRRAVIIGGPPMLLRSDGVVGVNDVPFSARERRSKFVCTGRGRGCATGLFIGKSITQKVEMQAVGISTAAFGHCTMEWQCLIAGAAERLPSCCSTHRAMHTVDAAWVTSTASSSTAVTAGRMRRPAE